MQKTVTTGLLPRLAGLWSLLGRGAGMVAGESPAESVNVAP